MENDESGRRRSRNFSKEEKICLLRIVKVFEKYIEEKKTDTQSNLLKNKAWNKVRNEFNKKVDKLNGIPRDTICLKSKYIDIKKSFKKALRDQDKLTDDIRSNIIDSMIEFEKSELTQPLPVEIKEEPLDIDNTIDMDDSEVEMEENIKYMDSKEVNKRSANYSLKEKVALISLVKKYKDIIMEPRSDGVLSKLKMEQWDLIAQQLHTLCPSGTLRSGQKLRDKFNDMKKSFRKKLKLPEEKTKNDCEFMLLKSVLDSLKSSNEDDQDNDDEDPRLSPQAEDAGENSSHGVEYSMDVEETIQDDSDSTEEEFRKKVLSANEQYYLDKNRREEEEHKLQVELLKIRIQKEKLEMERLLLDPKKGTQNETP